ncbi:MAG: DUF1552 domain-containing protein [Bryobacteraceae bacterium]
MFVTNKHLDRRAVLRGMGAALALPFLDAMAPAFAQGSSSKPVRLGFVYVPNGIIASAWNPTGEGAGFQFNSTMQALEPFREHTLVLSGLAQLKGRSYGDGGGDHARAGASWLTGVHPKKTEGADLHAGISADQVAARQLGKQTQFASLEIGVEAPSLAGGCDSGYSCAYTNTVSWRSPTTPNPMEVNPRVLFERLFGDGASTDAASRMEGFREQRSILDFVTGSVNRLSTKLGPGDRGKLAEYLEAVRDVERRIQKAEEQNASMTMPAMEQPASAPEDFVSHARLMMDLMVIAFQADLTRVASFMLARESSNRSYREIGISDGHHNCTHHQNDPEKIDKTIRINAHHVEQFAYLVNKMRSTPDGDGSLLDHSMILYGSSLADGNAHTHTDLPVAVLGGGCGKLKSGRHIRYASETPLNNLLLAMLDKAGVPTEKLGDSTGELQHLSDI